MQKTKRNHQIDQQIINLYNSGLNTYEVAERIKCSQTCVLNCLKQHNITRRSTSSYNTKYITNLNFFDKIDTEAKSYFLGLLYADGNNYVREKHSYEISIKLQQEDSYILEKLRDYLSPMTKLKLVKDKVTNNNHILFKINSKIVSNQLIDLGCVPNKSLVLKFPEIKENLILHFIRGYFDGDGCIYERVNNNGYVNYIWQVTSTNIFCHKLRDYLLKKIGVNGSIKLACPRTNKVTSTLVVGGNKQVKKVLSFIYQDCNYYLFRKYIKYNKLLQSSSSKTSSSKRSSA